MGADPEHGRRRACRRACCLPNTRAQEREAVRHEVTEQEWLDAATRVRTRWREALDKLAGR